MNMQARSRRLIVAVLVILTVSALGVGATASSGTPVKGSGLSVEVSMSGDGAGCSYWSSVGAFQTEGSDDFVYYHAIYQTDSGIVWKSGSMSLPDVLSGGPGRVTMSLATDELSANVVLTPNGRYSLELSGRIEERDDFGTFVGAFTGHRTENSADAVGAFTIGGWEPPVCDTSFGGWIGTERGTHTFR